MCETASLGVWVDAGSRHERTAQHGVAHMLEHMAFKGTERRSARAIAEEIEAVGGYLNAYTSREHTAYYARVLKEDLGLGLDLLADILQHSIFEPGELERERGVIVQEIGQVLDTPEDIIFDYLQEAAFPDQPIGRAILGTVETVKSFGRASLMGYMAEHYHGPRMVLVGGGRGRSRRHPAPRARSLLGAAALDPAARAAGALSGRRVPQEEEA